ncbi:MAG: hypothetical protein WD669_04460 [Pirellulales bacterium]
MNTFSWAYLLAQAAPAAEQVKPMSGYGWAIMIASVSSVLALTIFCIYRVYMLPPMVAEEHLTGPLEIDTGDTEDAD